MMNPFIDGERFSQMREGSIESSLAAAKQIAESYVGSPVEVLATHGDHMYVLADGESQIRRLGLRVEGGEVRVISNRYRDGYVDESSLDSYTASLLGECVDDLIEGDGRNRLRALASLVGPDSRVLFHEEYRDAMSVMSEPSYWRSVLESNSSVIQAFAYEGSPERKAKDESSVPSGRFSSMKSKELESFADELHQSLASLIEMAHNVLDFTGTIDAEGIKLAGCDAPKLLESLRDDCARLVDRGGKALEISRANHLPELAELHDSLARLVLPMTVMGRFIQSRSSEA